MKTVLRVTLFLNADRVILTLNNLEKKSPKIIW